MPEVDSHEPGEMVWADVAVPDPIAGAAFYAALFGWERQAAPLADGTPYTMMMVGRRPVAGVMRLSEEMRAQGARPAWTSYVLVGDIAAAVAAAEEGGGTVLVPPFPIGEDARLAIVADSEGAVLGLLEAPADFGIALWGEPGAPTWLELATRDAASAARFYGAVLGWGAERVEGAFGVYTMLTRGDAQVGGMIEMDERWGDLPPHWMPYYAVADVDVAAARAAELGGHVDVSPFDVPDVGRLAVIADPQGAHLSIMRLAPPPE